MYSSIPVVVVFPVSYMILEDSAHSSSLKLSQIISVHAQHKLLRGNCGATCPPNLAVWSVVKALEVMRDSERCSDILDS